MEINRLDILIMIKLKKKKAVNKLRGMTINEMNEYGGAERLASRSHLVRKLRFLEEKKYIAQGVRSGNSITYYVTESGLQYLEQEKTVC